MGLVNGHEASTYARNSAAGQPSVRSRNSSTSSLVELDTAALHEQLVGFLRGEGELGGPYLGESAARPQLREAAGPGLMRVSMIRCVFAGR